MGIQGLMSYCTKDHPKECVEHVDLVEIARQKNGIELLVDYYSFQHLIIRYLWKGLSQLRHNEYIRILGAEYGTIDTYVATLIHNLQNVGISLVFGVDGGKGASMKGFDRKVDTWIKRHHQDLEKFNDVFDVCKGAKRIDDLPLESSVRPVLLEIQIKQALYRCNCEIINCFGEADFRLAQLLISREKAYAIISNDSDFCIFVGSSFIPNDLFDLGNDLGLGSATSVPLEPIRLKCGVIRTESVMNTFGFQSYDFMIDFTILAGNDFITHQMRQQLRHSVGISGKVSVQTFVDWVNINGKVENNEKIAALLKSDQHLRDAVKHSRKFYNLELDSEDELMKRASSNQSVHLREAVEAGELASNSLGIYNNIYWHRMLLEDDAPGQPCIEIALRELRSYIYRIILPRDEQLVTEFGRTPYEKFRKAGILAHPAGDRRVPNAHLVDRDKVFQNLRTFYYIIQHQEPSFPINFFDKYGRKTGFVCFVLRYFLVLNWSRNLCITQNEFFSLVAMAFSKADESRYQSIQICPMVRTVTIANWFQDVYRHAYSFLAQLLLISHEFPEPREIFSGSAWIVFHTLSSEEAWNHGIAQVSQEVLSRAQREMTKTLATKKHVLNSLVEGVFQYSAQW